MLTCLFFFPEGVCLLRLLLGSVQSFATPAIIGLAGLAPRVKCESAERALPCSHVLCERLHVLGQCAFAAAVALVL